ncbi:MAG TPA: GNAT family N-acetyltransferase [Dokdonella sp.]
MDVLEIDTDAARLDVDWIARFLAEEAYWSRGIRPDVVRRAIAGSLCFGGYLGARQVAFARVVTDGATVAYLADVFVHAECRGRGYGGRLIEAVRAHAEVRAVRRVLLATADAHAFYARFGFAAPARLERFMEILDVDAYVRADGAPQRAVA